MALIFVDLEKAFDTVPRKNGNGYCEMHGSTTIRNVLLKLCMRTPME